MRKFRRMLDAAAKLSSIGNFGCRCWEWIRDNIDSL